MQHQLPVGDLGLTELRPLFCGYEDCDGGHTYGPAVREYYLLHYIRSGKGTYLCRGREYALSAGQCFLINPGEVTVYAADAGQPWTYVWLAFDGVCAPRFLRSAGLGPDRPVTGSPEISAAFDGLYQLITDGADSAGNGFRLLSVLYAFFGAIPQQGPRETQRGQYVRKVRGFVAASYAGRLTAEALASYCGLDRRYLCRVFKAETGATLQEYVLSVRMGKAAGLLRSTALPVGDVARSVGYYDVYNFSKMFKKKAGLSPLDYRQALACRRAAEKTGRENREDD